MIVWDKEITQEEKDMILMAYYGNPKVHKRAHLLEIMYGECIVIMNKDGTFELVYTNSEGKQVSEMM